MGRRRRAVDHAAPASGRRPDPEFAAQGVAAQTVAAQAVAARGVAAQTVAAETVAARGVAVLVVDAPADRVPAEEFLADDGPLSGVDAVLVSAMAAHGPAIAARRAVAAMTELVRALPGDHRLRWAVERVGVDAHEFAELDLLQDLERGDLLRGVVSSAARLLGADGVDPRSRLGLPEGATTDEIRSRARDEVTRWRAHAEHPASGGRDRVACEVLVRTAEGLFTP